MRFVSLSSSSSGNCELISYKNTNILVDCGISKKRLLTYLQTFGLTLDDIDCIFVTHSHYDHISGISMVIRDTDIKVIGLRDTLMSVVDSLKKISSNINYDNFKIINPVNYLNENSCIVIKDIKVFPFKGCHDVPSLYYKFSLDDTNLAILTDIGECSENVIISLKDIDYLMLECNYDVEMLMNSKRPDMLKSRIAGPKGHLSNVQCCEIISKIACDRIKKIYLSHISGEANNEEYALSFVREYLGTTNILSDYLNKVFVAKRLEPTVIVDDIKI